MQGRVVLNRKLHFFRLSDVERITRKLTQDPEPLVPWLLRWVRTLGNLLDRFNEKVIDVVAPRVMRPFLHFVRRIVGWLFDKMFEMTWEAWGAEKRGPQQPKIIGLFGLPIPVEYTGGVSEDSEGKYDGKRDLKTTFLFIMALVNQWGDQLYGKRYQSGSVR